MCEVDASNKESIKIKAHKREEERQLEQKIIDYQRAKDKIEEEKAAEAVRVAAEKEKELQRLLALNEKANDRQAEIDEAKAKRAREEADKIARARAECERIKGEKVKKDLEVARVKQFRDKEDCLTVKAKAERDDFLRIVQKQKDDEELERQLEAAKKAALIAHRIEVQSQIVKNADVRHQDKLDYMEEGRKLRAKLDDNRNKIKRIQGEKIMALGQAQI